MPCVLRLESLAIALSLSSPAFAQSPQTFTASDNSYTFQFPESFSLSHMFADGTGDVTGVTASSMENGDVNITFSGPRDSGDINEVSKENQQAIIDEFTQAIAVLPSIKFQSVKMTAMLGQPAIDMGLPIKGSKPSRSIAMFSQCLMAKPIVSSAFTAKKKRISLHLPVISLFPPFAYSKTVQTHPMTRIRATLPPTEPARN